MRKILNTDIIRKLVAMPASWRLVYKGGDVRPATRPPRVWQNWIRVNQHKHLSLDIMMVLRGDSWYGLDGEIYACRPGTVFIFMPHQVHACGYPPGRNDFDHLWMGVMHGEVLARVASARHGRWNFKSQQNSIVVSLEHCGLSCPLLLPADGASALELRLRFTALVAALLAGVLSANLRQTTKMPDRQTLISRKISAIRRHIMNTGGNDAHLDHLAHMAGYSKFHFLRIFKRETGMTVHEYVTQCRHKKANELRASGLSMKEIAAQLGFASSSSFSHWLRQYRGS